MILDAIHSYKSYKYIHRAGPGPGPSSPGARDAMCTTSTELVGGGRVITYNEQTSTPPNPSSPPLLCCIPCHAMQREAWDNPPHTTKKKQKKRLSGEAKTNQSPPSPLPPKQSHPTPLPHLSPPPARLPRVSSPAPLPPPASPTPHHSARGASNPDHLKNQPYLFTYPANTDTHGQKAPGPLWRAPPWATPTAEIYPLPRRRAAGAHTARQAVVSHAHVNHLSSTDSRARRTNV